MPPARESAGAQNLTKIVQDCVVEHYDVGIVGAGIAGLSLAWHLRRAGKRVIVLEQSAQAGGPSTRNFGMIWIVGQPKGDLQTIATRSGELWQEAADEIGFWISNCGSLTLAYEPLEHKVIEEYYSSIEGSHARELLVSEEVQDRFPFVRQDGLWSAMYSPTEFAVDPREVVHKTASFLRSQDVEIRFDTRVTAIESGQISTSSGDTIRANKIVVCPGPDLFALYPEAYKASGLTQCRLQMMRLQRNDRIPKRLGVHLCAGLTLGHYANFKECPSLDALKDFHQDKWPRQVEKGIHVLVSQQPDGSITVGDSHEYGRNLTPYRSEAIDAAILEALDEFLPIEEYEIVQRWEGTYNTHPTNPYWWEQLDNSVWGLNLFGTGMTLSFGLTERISQQLV